MVLILQSLSASNAGSQACLAVLVLTSQHDCFETDEYLVVVLLTAGYQRQELGPRKWSAPRLAVSGESHRPQVGLGSYPIGREVGDLGRGRGLRRFELPLLSLPTACPGLETLSANVLPVNTRSSRISRFRSRLRSRIA